MARPQRLGLIGASVGGGSSGTGSWAARSHMPYLKSADNDNYYQVVAFQNSSKEAASHAAKAFGLPDAACYGDHTEIASDANVDVVAISVNVPRHYDAIVPSLDAGKDIFSEWPLARNLAEAEDLVRRAKQKNVATMIGLQARQSPSIIAVRKLVADGAIGDILGTTMKGYGIILGESTSTAFAYGMPIENGANLLTIPFGHAVDALCFTLGELEYVSATLANRRPEVPLVEPDGKDAGMGTRTSHDVVSVSGVLANGGGVVNVVYMGGMNPTGGPGFVWQIDGTKGVILLEGPMGHVQMFQPTVKMALKGEKEMKEVEVHKIGRDFSYAVGRAWTAFAKHKRGESIESGSLTTWDDALVRHRMIDAIYRSHEKGTREKYI